MVRLAGDDPAASAMSGRRSPDELKTRDWNSVPGSSRVMAVCRTAAFPSGARSVVPGAGFEPAPKLVLSKRPLPLGYPGKLVLDRRFELRTFAF